MSSRTLVALSGNRLAKRQRGCALALEPGFFLARGQGNQSMDGSQKSGCLRSLLRISPCVSLSRAGTAWWRMPGRESSNWPAAAKPPWSSAHHPAPRAENASLVDSHANLELV